MKDKGDKDMDKGKMKGKRKGIKEIRKRGTGQRRFNYKFIKTNECILISFLQGVGTTTIFPKPGNPGLRQQ